MVRLVRIGVFLLALASVFACGAMESWWGDYRYQAALGKTAGGTPIIVEYALRVGEETCRLSVDGYQVSEDILCLAVADDRHLEVRFKSYADGSLTNIYDVQVYRPGEPLFSLSKRDGKLVTHWESLYPGEKAPPDGFYFFRE